MTVENYKNTNLNTLDCDNQEYLNELVELFILTNPNALISKFGKNFVEDFVINFCKLKDRNIYFYLYNHKVIGYVFYLNNINTLQNLNPNYFKLFMRILIKPKIILDIIKNFGKNKLRNNFNNKTGYLIILDKKTWEWSQTRFSL